MRPLIEPEADSFNARVTPGRIGHNKIWIHAFFEPEALVMGRFRDGPFVLGLSRFASLTAAACGLD